MEISKTDKELRLFFNNSIFGAFFMMLDKPITWNDQANKEELIEYILHHLRITRVNQAFLDQYSSEEKEMIGKTPFDFFEHDLDQEKTLLTNIFNHGKFRGVSYEQKKDGTRVVFEGDYVVLYEDDDPQKRVIGVFGVQQEITKRIEQQEKLQKALEEKDMLLSEIHHRIKNNLSIISGLLNIQVLETDNEIVKEKLTDSMFRIQTVAKIHDIIYHEKHFSEIDFSITLEKLIHSIREVFLDGKSIDVQLDLDAVYLDMKHAIPFALIVNELVTNIFKHAFKGKESGKINVHIYQKEAHIHFKIEDDGVGIPKDFNLKKSNSLGIQMILMLSQQINGEPVFDNNKPGTRFLLKFPAIF